jgi:hypothetical protein
MHYSLFLCSAYSSEQTASILYRLVLSLDSSLNLFCTSNIFSSRVGENLRGSQELLESTADPNVHGRSLRDRTAAQRRRFRRNSRWRTTNRVRARTRGRTRARTRARVRTEAQDVENQDEIVVRRKKTAAQKRMFQRDRRRHRERPDRTYEEAFAERLRKDRQAGRRGRPRTDPYHREYGDPDFAAKRSMRRRQRCRNSNGDSDCNWKALDPDPDRRPNYEYDRIHGTTYFVP